MQCEYFSCGPDSESAEPVMAQGPADGRLVTGSPEKRFLGPETPSKTEAQLLAPKAASGKFLSR